MNTIVLDGLDYTGSDPGPMGAADDHRMALWCMRLDDIVISFKYLYGERRLGLGHKPEIKSARPYTKFEEILSVPFGEPAINAIFQHPWQNTAIPEETTERLQPTLQEKVRPILSLFITGVATSNLHAGQGDNNSGLYSFHLRAFSPCFINPTHFLF